jgi:hypothetical protein
LANAGAKEDMFDGLEADIIMLVEIAFVCSIGVLIIDLFVLLVHRRRSKAKKESSWTVLDASSSDDQRKENLVEKVE